MICKLGTCPRGSKNSLTRHDVSQKVYATSWLSNALFSVMLVCALLAPNGANADNKGSEAYAAGDYAQALKIWRPLANQGVAEAQFNLGAMFEHGAGVTSSDATAVQWYRRAAEQGHVGAQFNLGNMYCGGRGMAPDLKRGMHWLRKAAEQGDASAQFNLAMKYHRESTVRDYSQAAAWYLKASMQNHVSAMVNLGTLTMAGQGIAKDDARAAELYLRAAEQGNALAQTYLGDMYSWGRGFKRDVNEAAGWYRKSAEQGEFEGLLNLAKSYRDGAGVPVDPVLAYVFASHDPNFRKFNLAERSKLAEELQEGLTSEQRAEATELINTWISTKMMPVRSRKGDK